MAGKRKVEIFSAACQGCDEAVKLVSSIAWSSCKVTVLDMNEPNCGERGQGPRRAVSAYDGDRRKVGRLQLGLRAGRGRAENRQGWASRSGESEGHWSTKTDALCCHEWKARAGYFSGGCGTRPLPSLKVL